MIGITIENIFQLCNKRLLFTQLYYVRVRGTQCDDFHMNDCCALTIHINETKLHYNTLPEGKQSILFGIAIFNRISTGRPKTHS